MLILMQFCNLICKSVCRTVYISWNKQINWGKSTFVFAGVLRFGLAAGWFSRHPGMYQCSQHCQRYHWRPGHHHHVCHGRDAECRGRRDVYWPQVSDRLGLTQVFVLVFRMMKQENSRVASGLSSLRSPWSLVAPFWNILRQLKGIGKTMRFTGWKFTVNEVSKFHHGRLLVTINIVPLGRGSKIRN